MTRSERVTKLGRAIWEYRGKQNGDSGKWRTGQSPKPKAGDRCRRWLRELGVVDIEVTMKRIDQLPSRAAYNEFLAELTT